MSSSSSSSSSTSSSSSSSPFTTHHKSFLQQYGIDEFSCGCLGGIGKVLAGHPFDTVKGRMQYGGYGKTPFEVVKTTFQHEGMRGFYRGLVPPCVAVGFVSGTLFFVNGRVRKFIQPDYPHNKEPLTYLQMLFAASCGGAAVGCVVTPFEVLKVNRQIASSSSASATSSSSTTISGIINNPNGFGLRGLYCGFGATLIRESGTFGFFFPINEFLRAQVINWRNSSSNNSTITNNNTTSLPIYLRVLCAGTSGMICWFPFYPIDQIKTRIQTQSFSGASSTRKMLSMTEAFRQLMKEGGVRVMYRGLTPCLVRAFPAYSAQYTTFETALHWVRG